MTVLRRWAGLGLVVSVLVTAVSLAACGGGGDGDGGSGDLSGIVDQRPTIASAKPEQIIEVKESSFSPNTVTIKSGTKVIWKWTAATACAIQYAGSTGPEQTSGTYERVFDQTGSSFTYQCANNTAMTGKIVIE